MLRSFYYLTATTALLSLHVEVPSTNPVDTEQRRLAISVAASDKIIPDPTFISEAEHSIERQQLVLDISRWDRRYCYGLDQQGNLDITRGKFIFKRTKDGRIGQRVIESYARCPELDDSQCYLIEGYYRRQPRRLVVSYRGFNRARAF